MPLQFDFIPRPTTSFSVYINSFSSSVAKLNQKPKPKIWRQNEKLRHQFSSVKNRKPYEPYNSTISILICFISNLDFPHSYCAGNCEITVEVNKFTCKADSNCTVISIPRSGKIKVSGIIQCSFSLMNRKKHSSVWVDLIIDFYYFFFIFCFKQWFQMYLQTIITLLRISGPKIEVKCYIYMWL